MKTAEVAIYTTVRFHDDGVNELKDQAVETAINKTGLHHFEINDVVVFGEVKDERMD